MDDGAGEDFDLQVGGVIRLFVLYPVLTSTCSFVFNSDRIDCTEESDVNTNLYILYLYEEFLKITRALCA